MLLIILPLAKKGKEVKQKVIEQVVDLAKQIEDENALEKWGVLSFSAVLTL